MKKKLFAALLFFAGVTTSLLWISCNSGKGPSATKTDCPPYDTTQYKVVYSKDGYVLLRSLSSGDSIAFTDKASQRISDDTASRMIKYYIKRRRGPKQPITIDFDYNSIAYIMTVLDSPNTPYNEKKKLRIYLSAYDTKLADELHPDLTPAQRAELDGYLTTILVGMYDDEEKTDAVNLGNICPPNCPDDGDGATPTARPIGPNRVKAKLYEKAMYKRSDIYN